jgi:glycosyltransferase involved in cell wall biosynthesis
MVVVDAEGGEQEYAALREQEFKVHYGVPVQPKPNTNAAQKLSWVLNPRRSYSHGCGVDCAAVGQLQRIAAEFDIIWFAKLRTPNMFPKWTWSRSVADIDDVPSLFEATVLASARGLKAWLMACLRYQSWKRRDRLVGERFSVLGVCSELDKRYLQSLNVTVPVHVIPNGFERPARPPVRMPATPPRIGFIGIFDYAPNLGGIQWFARECWPRIKRELPEARLRLVGRYSDGPLKPNGPDIDGLGWVANADEEMATWSSMVVPLQLGAGTRGKIAHAFSTKCPVVSTSLGAYGYETKSGRELLLADTAEDFASACVSLVRCPVEASAMAERAWSQFLEKWTWDAIRPRVWAAAEDCLRLNAQVGRNALG